jgi:hypothetical protein
LCFGRNRNHPHPQAARDLEPIQCSPFLQLQVIPDLKDEAKKDIKKTDVRINAKHPRFDSQFQWEVRGKDVDLEQTRLHLTMFDMQKTALGQQKTVFLGSMSFALCEIFDPENPSPDGGLTGWYKLLDEKKGFFQSQQFIPKTRKAGAAPASKALGGGAVPSIRAPEPTPVSKRPPAVGPNFLVCQQPSHLSPLVPRLRRRLDSWSRVPVQLVWEWLGNTLLHRADAPANIPCCSRRVDAFTSCGCGQSWSRSRCIATRS